MKKSNILIVVSVVILLVALTGYNIALKNQYLSGAHKNPYHNFEALDHTNFDIVAVDAASEISVTIKQGPEHKVYVRKDDKENITVKQMGKTLVVEVTYPKDRRNFDRRERVVITLPKLKQVTADAKYIVGGKPVVFKNTQYQRSWTSLKISGFKQDSLLLEQNNVNAVELNDNTLGALRAITGKNAGSENHLTINNSNKIARAHLDIQNKSSLHLQNITIPALTYQFSDSAHVNFSGAALAILKK